MRESQKAVVETVVDRYTRPRFVRVPGVRRVLSHAQRQQVGRRAKGRPPSTWRAAITAFRLREVAVKANKTGWTGGRAVDGSSLENWRSFTGSVGSNPTLSANDHS